MKFDPIYGQWVDQLLADVADKIQLTPSAYERAVDRYNRIAGFLSENLSGIADLSPVIYPQGSFRIGTTISACEDNEDYDIDLMLEINIDPQSDPDAVLQRIADVMERGRGTLQFTSCRKKKRCVTIEYADMHLDITPAVLLDPANPRVVGIFDRHPERADHAIANPEGFARWFDERVLPQTMLEKRALRAHTYPVPDQQPIENKPDRLLAVQLLKRFRDRACDERNYNRCPSVLVSKLAAEAPSGNGLYGDLRNVIHTVREGILRIPPAILNPRCGADILSDRWPEAARDQDEFARDLTRLEAELSELLESGSQVEKLRVLEGLFGERPARRAYAEATKRLGEQSSAGNMAVGLGTGAMGASAAVKKTALVPPHKFYGGDG